MQILNVEILNPKAKKLLLDLADLKLISISEKKETSFLDIVKKIRAKKQTISMEEITKEVNAVRAKNNAK